MKYVEMTFSQRLAILSLIHKKGERCLLNNYKPISLQKSPDYNIIACIFTTEKEQTAYIKGTNIGTNDRLIFDISECYGNSTEERVAIIL